MSETILLTHPGGSSARIAPHLGFNCYEFKAAAGGQTVEVIDAAEDFADGNQRPSGHGIPILFPYPNRIRGGRFDWDGVRYELPDSIVPFDGAGNAIHGFCLDRSWRVTETGESFVTATFQLSADAPDRYEHWPADARIEVRYELTGPALICDVRIENPSRRPLPWGFGTHPYFKLPLSPQSKATDCTIQVPATRQWELVDCLPTGEQRTSETADRLREGEYFGAIQLDDVLTGLQETGGVLECLIYDEPAGLQLSQRFPSHFREVVAYTPPGRRSVCLEPYTCVTDAVNLQARGVEAGWRVLEPDGEFRTRIEIAVGPIIV